MLREVVIKTLQLNCIIYKKHLGCSKYNAKWNCTADTAEGGQEMSCQ